MNDVCKGQNCEATGGGEHSTECKFEHFLSYSGNWDSPECQEMLNLVEELRERKGV